MSGVCKRILRMPGSYADDTRNLELDRARDSLWGQIHQEPDTSDSFSNTSGSRFLEREASPLLGQSGYTGIPVAGYLRAVAVSLTLTLT